MEVEKLIESVWRRSLLWQNEDPNHHNRYMLDKAWKDIGSVMGITAKSAQRKWKYLRDYYRAELRKEEQGRCGDPTIKFESSWPHFKSLFFLKDQFREFRESVGSIQSVQLSDNCLEDQEELIMEGEAKIHPSSSPSADEESAFPTRGTPTWCTYTSTPNSDGNKAPKRKRKTHLTEELIEIERQRLSILRESAKAKQQHDDDDMDFFRSLVPYVRDLKKKKKIECRMKIMEVILSFTND